MVISTIDRDGLSVCVGDFIKVLHIDDALLATLRETELRLAKSMLGEEFCVIEIADGGYAIVEKEDRLKDGTVISQFLSLAPIEMKRTRG